MIKHKDILDQFEANLKGIAEAHNSSCNRIFRVHAKDCSNVFRDDAWAKTLADLMNRVGI